MWALINGLSLESRLYSGGGFECTHRHNERNPRSLNPKLMRGNFEAYHPLSVINTGGNDHGLICLPIIALVLSLAAITLVILDNLVMCRRILFCASTVVSFPDGVKLVQNGGFEAGSLQPNMAGFISIPVGSSALPTGKSRE